jgi:hypothetical protein
VFLREFQIKYSARTPTGSFRNREEKLFYKGIWYIKIVDGKYIHKPRTPKALLRRTIAVKSSNGMFWFRSIQVAYALQFAFLFTSAFYWI